MLKPSDYESNNPEITKKSFGITMPVLMPFIKISGRVLDCNNR